jgi:transposase
MTTNDSPTEEYELTPKQAQLIAALVVGNSIVDAAKAVGIGEKTAHRWLKQPAFDQAYQDAKQAVFNQSLEDVKTIRETLLYHIEARVGVTPASQLQAAKLLHEQYIVADELAELKEQLNQVQETLQSLGAEL